MNIIGMMCSGILFMSICLLVDHLILERLFYLIKGSTKPKLLKPASAMDDDVKTEMEKVDKMTNSELKSGNLVLQKLTKIYSQNLAVNQLNLGIDNAECFGLLVSFFKNFSVKDIFFTKVNRQGVNGAGKKTFRFDQSKIVTLKPMFQVLKWPLKDFLLTLLVAFIVK